MLLVKRGTNGRENMVEEGEAEGEGSPSPQKTKKLNAANKSRWRQKTE